MEVLLVRDSIPNSLFIDKEVATLQTLQMISNKYGKTLLICSQNKHLSISNSTAIRERVPINPLPPVVSSSSKMIQVPKTLAKQLVTLNQPLEVSPQLIRRKIKHSSNSSFWVVRQYHSQQESVSTKIPNPQFRKSNQSNNPL